MVPKLYLSQYLVTNSYIQNKTKKYSRLLLLSFTRGNDNTLVLALREDTTILKKPGKLAQTAKYILTDFKNAALG